MKSGLYVGTVAHQRFIPKVHQFQYHFFMWFLDLTDINAINGLAPYFSTKRFSLSRFNRADYLGNPNESLAQSVRNRLAELTGKSVDGKIFGLLNLRTLGLYFSPVNFYFGYDTNDCWSHFLAEVANTPWNERHHYAHYVGDGNHTPNHPKAFKVSPFNKIDQHYHWEITPPSDQVQLAIKVSDERGHIFTARLGLKRHELSKATIRRQLLRKPIMTAFIIASIYWQALKLYVKGVPYVPYQKELT